MALFILLLSAEFASLLFFIPKVFYVRHTASFSFQSLPSDSMASVLQKLIRKSPPSRLIAALGAQTSQNLSTPFILHQPLDFDKKSDAHSHSNLNSASTSNPSQFSQFYPSFPFGLCLPQISSTGLLPFEPDYVEQDDSRKLWADSVKKKRKRKMNKHKYKKLRKRLRRQT